MEHEGRLLCSGCIARIAAAGERRKERRAALRRAGAATFGTLALWLVFYGVGALLLRIPPDFHDGTVWKKIVERTGE